MNNPYRDSTDEHITQSSTQGLLVGLDAAAAFSQLDRGYCTARNMSPSPRHYKPGDRYVPMYRRPSFVRGHRGWFEVGFPSRPLPRQSLDQVTRGTRTRTTSRCSIPMSCPGIAAGAGADPKHLHRWHCWNPRLFFPLLFLSRLALFDLRVSVARELGFVP